MLQQIQLQGSTPYSYGRENGISPSSLYRWRKLLGTSLHHDLPQLVEITPAAAPTPAPMPPPKTVYELQLGDITLRVDEYFQDHTLARLIGVLRSC